MDCQKISVMLADYSVDNLEASAARMVEEHLRDCAECSRRLARLVEVGELVQGMESLEPPAEIWQEIRAGGEEFFAAPSKQEAPSPRALRWAFASAMAAVLIFFLSVFFSLRFFGPQPPQVLTELPARTVYSGQPVVSQSEMVNIFNEHAAISTRDALSDPVSLGLVSFTSREPVVEQER
ncbi:MAG: hypothetical protein GTN69_06855 [Armatimonadetes bacterium]|nr:hypothetical protein [Armatimonadota bacterium]NIO75591.1 hypothetical protein [Armatimonadota bacterium]NIO98645.1 hypothetical protein [Armatimonadota bacterium]